MGVGFGGVLVLRRKEKAFLYLCAGHCTELSIHGAYRGPEKAPDSLELDLQINKFLIYKTQDGSFNVFKILPGESPKIIVLLGAMGDESYPFEMSTHIFVGNR